jgi:diguanylate cyclase (GGDEF)-like protein
MSSTILKALVVGCAALAVREHVRARAFRQAALFDPLTEVANRRAFDAALAQRDAELRRGAAPGAIALIDLAALKRINDTDGLSAGDAILVRAAAALKTTTRRADLLARLGGDEFAVLLTSPADPDPVRARLQAALAGEAITARIVVVPAADRGYTAALTSAGRALAAAKNRP